jgi:MFS family permease
MVLRGAILRETFGGASFGRILGSTMLFASVGSIAGPTLAGWVYDTIGSYEVIWVSFAGLHLLAMALIGRLK